MTTPEPSTPPKAEAAWPKRLWSKLRRKTDGRTAPPPASRRFVAVVFLLLAVGVGGAIIGFQQGNDATNARIDKRSQARDLQRQSDVAALSKSLATAQQALKTANAAASSAQKTSAAVQQAACFIFEQPAPPSRSAAEAALILQIRTIAHCTPNPTDLH